MEVSAYQILEGLDEAGAQTRDQLEGLLRVQPEELDQALHEVSTQAWVATQEWGYEGKETRLPYLILTDEGRAALKRMRTEQP